MNVRIPILGLLGLLMVLFSGPLSATPLPPHQRAPSPMMLPRLFAQATQLANATKIAYFAGNVGVSNPTTSRIYKFLPSGALDSFSYTFSGALGFDVGNFSTTAGSNPLWVWKYVASDFGVIGYIANSFGQSLNQPWDTFDMCSFTAIGCNFAPPYNRVTEVDFSVNTARLLLFEQNTGRILWTPAQQPINTLFDMGTIIYPANYLPQNQGETLRHIAADPHSDLFYFASSSYIFSGAVYAPNSASLLLSRAQIIAATGVPGVSISGFTTDGQQLFFYDTISATLYRADMTTPTIQIHPVMTQAQIQALTGNTNGLVVQDIDVELNPTTGLARSIFLLDGLANTSGRGSLVQIFVGP